MSEPTEAMDALRRAGFLDDLTWLPSKLLFRDRLERALAWGDRHGGRVALIYVDLEGFGALNERLGREACDEILQEVGRRLTEGLRREDSVARTGSDEFALLLPEVDSASGAALVGRKVRQLFDVPFELEGGEERVGAAVACAVYPDHAFTLDPLLTAADAALAHARSSGATDVVMYASGMSGDAPAE